MRCTMSVLALGWVAFLIGGVGGVEAATLTLTPGQAAVVTAEGVEDTRVAWQFDLSDLSGGQIAWAVLEWAPAGVPQDGWSEYRLVQVTAAWTEAGLAADAAPAMAEEDAGWWEYSPRDFERNGGGLIRFDVTDLVSAWVMGKSDNHGVVLVTSDLNRAAIATQIETVKLIVAYLPANKPR